MLRGEWGAEQGCSNPDQDVPVAESPRKPENRGTLASPEVAGVLLEARRRIIREGWAPVVRPAGVRLFDAVWSQAVTVARWEARRILEDLGRCKLFEWDALPLSSQAGAIALLEYALRQLGVEPTPVRRGGWRVA